MKPAPASASRSSLASCGKVGALAGSPLVVNLFKSAGLGCEWVFQMGLWISLQKTWLTSQKSPLVGADLESGGGEGSFSGKKQSFTGAVT